MSAKKPFTKTQKIVLFGGVGVALVAIAVKAAFFGSPSTSTPPPPPATPPASHSALIHSSAQKAKLPSHATPTSFVPQIHALPKTVQKPTNKPTVAQTMQAIDLLQSASAGTAWGIYAQSVPEHPGWFSVLYRTSVSGANHYAISWVNVSQHLLVLGSVLNPEGVPWKLPERFLLTALRHGIHLPHTPTGVTSSAKSRLQAWQSPGITMGKKGPLVTVFFDPNSAKAAELYSTLSAFASAGKIQVHWVPVAVLRKSSLYRSEYMLSAPEPSIVLKDDLAHFHYHLGKGGSPALYNAPTLMMESVDNNSNVLAATGQIGPLAIFYCQGKHLQARYRLPASTLWPTLVNTLDNQCGS